MNVRITGVEIDSISTCLANNEVDLKSLSHEYGEEEVNKIMKVTGINKVRHVGLGETSSDLCCKAADHLFENISINRESIDGIVFVSQTRDYIIPATSPNIQSRLGLSQNVVAFDVPYGCTGYIYGLYLSSMLISSGSCKNVLLLAGDTNSKTISMQDRSVSMVFGDGGSATLIKESVNKSIYFNIKTDGSGYDKLIIPFGGYRNPSNSESSIIKKRENNNYRSDEDLFMDGMSVFNFAINSVPEMINESLNHCGLKKEEIDIYGLHQANDLMLKYIRKKIKIDSELMPFTANLYGNTGPASIPILLCDLFSSKNEKNLKNSLLCGFGVGLTWGLSILDLSDTKFLKTINY